MNKQELIDAVAADADMSKARAKVAVDAVLDNISGALSAGRDVAFVGFGTFTVKKTSARTGRNPQTGKPIEIAAKKRVTFKAGKALADLVN